MILMTERWMIILSVGAIQKKKLKKNYEGFEQGPISVREN
jgi:hypothetical protein